MNKILTTLFKMLAVLAVFFLVQSIALIIVFQALIRFTGSTQAFLSFIAASAVAVFAAYRIKQVLFKADYTKVTVSGEEMHDEAGSTDVRPLSDKAKSIAAWRGHGWEYLFFVRVLLDEIESLKDMRVVHSSGGFLGMNETVDSELAYPLLQNKLEGFLSALKKIAIILNVKFKAALVCHDTTEKAKNIHDAANRFGDVYSELIFWTFSLRKISFPKELEKTAEILSSMAEPVLSEIERWSENSYTEISSALQGSSLDSVGKKKSLNLVLKIQAPQKLFDEFNAELRRLSGVAENGRL